LFLSYAKNQTTEIQGQRTFHPNEHRRSIFQVG